MFDFCVMGALHTQVHEYWCDFAVLAFNQMIVLQKDSMAISNTREI
jgi:hypothetical protein